MPRSKVEIPGLVRLVTQEAKECRLGRRISWRAEIHMELRQTAKAYYFHRFYDFRPDLNTANPEVQAEILKIMGFWLQLGVSGFRMDAVPFVIAEKGTPVTRPTEQYDMLRMFSEFLTWRKGEAIILAEANVLPDKDLSILVTLANDSR
jgi:glycosidase